MKLWPGYTDFRSHARFYPDESEIEEVSSEDGDEHRRPEAPLSEIKKTSLSLIREGNEDSASPQSSVVNSIDNPDTGEMSTEDQTEDPIEDDTDKIRTEDQMQDSIEEKGEDDSSSHSSHGSGINEDDTVETSEDDHEIHHGEENLQDTDSRHDEESPHFPTGIQDDQSHSGDDPGDDTLHNTQQNNGLSYVESSHSQDGSGDEYADADESSLAGRDSIKDDSFARNDDSLAELQAEHTDQMTEAMRDSIRQAYWNREMDREAVRKSNGYKSIEDDRKRQIDRQKEHFHELGLTKKSYDEEAKDRKIAFQKELRIIDELSTIKEQEIRQEQNRYDLREKAIAAEIRAAKEREQELLQYSDAMDKRNVEMSNDNLKREDAVIASMAKMNSNMKESITTAVEQASKTGEGVALGKIQKLEEAMHKNTEIILRNEKSRIQQQMKDRIAYRDEERKNEEIRYNDRKLADNVELQKRQKAHELRMVDELDRLDEKLKNREQERAARRDAHDSSKLQEKVTRYQNTERKREADALTTMTQFEMMEDMMVQLREMEKFISQFSPVEEISSLPVDDIGDTAPYDISEQLQILQNLEREDEVLAKYSQSLSEASLKIKGQNDSNMDKSGENDTALSDLELQLPPYLQINHNPVPELEITRTGGVSFAQVIDNVRGELNNMQIKMSQIADKINRKFDVEFAKIHQSISANLTESESATDVIVEAALHYRNYLSHMENRMQDQMSQVKENNSNNSIHSKAKESFQDNRLSEIYAMLQEIKFEHLQSRRIIVSNENICNKLLYVHSPHRDLESDIHESPTLMPLAGAVSLPETKPFTETESLPATESVHTQDSIDTTISREAGPQSLVSTRIETYEKNSAASPTSARRKSKKKK